MEVKSGKANLFIQAQKATSSEAKLTEEAKTTATLTSPVTAVASKKASATGAKSVKSEIQMSASATQAELSKRLAQKFNAEPTEKKKSNNPLLNSIRLRLHDYVPPTGRKSKAITPMTLSTGSGNDVVNIQMGNDGRVHVQVNGKEAWSGSVARFKKLTIDTGDGNDVVTNSVDGARIVTGKGSDKVWNKANNSSIDTGDDKDIVWLGQWDPESLRSIPYPINSNGNQVNTGSGDDEVTMIGDKNTILTGSGDDKVKISFGVDNKINTGVGDDTVDTVFASLWENNIKDPDKT